MACLVYTKICIVIKKIKLNEADLILEVVGEDGALLRFVAKSARKPGNTFSNRLELCNVARVTCAKCKGLDIVREVRVISQRGGLRANYIKFVCACTILELSQKLCLEDKTNSVTFEFLSKTIDVLETCDDEYALIILVAALIKFVSIEGLKPELSMCLNCRSSVDLKNTYSTFFSFKSGGVVCDDCAEESDYEFYSTSIITLKKLLDMTYDEILKYSFELNSEDYADIFDILDKWIMYYVNYSIKSLKLLYRLV